MDEGADEAPASPGRSRHRFEDPRAIRALAHPARLAIINALATGAELTATQCAELTGLSPSATAYHLKFLERYGFAEAVPPTADRRERPWRAAGRPTAVDLDGSTTAGATAAAAVVAAYIDTTRAIAVDFVEGAHHEPEAWQAAALHNVDLWLTAEELAQVARQLEGVLEPYRGRSDEAGRPPACRRVRIMSVLVPHPNPSS